MDISLDSERPHLKRLTEMNLRNCASRIVGALVIGLAVFTIALSLTRAFPLADDSFLPSSFITHTSVWVLSILLIAIVSRGRLETYGLTGGSFRFTPRILLWMVPTAVMSVMGFAASRSGGEIQEVVGLSKLQNIIFVWVYASVSEEIFTRGLLQSFLSPLRKYGISPFNRGRLSVPVLFSGLYFGGMHIVLIDRLGPAVVVTIVLTTFLGLVAGHYRERTGSLVPAIIIHALFNVGGMLPMWLLNWIF
jgi:membrane protease YdiL (CAAX protease family)